MTFLERYKELGSPTDHDTISKIMDDMVDDWHEDDSEKNLPEYLGFHPIVYGQWVSDPNFIFEIIKAFNKNE